MQKHQLRNSLLLVLAALIWGIAFVAQSENAIGALSFNAIRSLLGALVLVPVIFLLDKVAPAKTTSTKEERKILWKGGALIGVALFFASNLQQVGINLGTAAGKAGFLTATYILIVPIMSLLLSRRCGFNIWIGVVIALVGLYLLCIHGEFYLQKGDFLLLLCAVVFAVQILLIEHYAPQTNPVKLSCVEFLVSGTLTAICAVFVEVIPEGVGVWAESLYGWDAWIPILYTGIFSCGVAYTLQIVGQNGLNSTIASLIMSLESVFSVLAGWIILHEKLSNRELLGCVLIFTAIVIAQLPVTTWIKKVKK